MHGHDHGHASDPSRANRRRLGFMLALSASYMVVEAAGGLWTGSLALLADAGHLLSDVGAIALGWTALWLAQRPASARRTYGHRRSEILAALANGSALGLVAIFIALEALDRFAEPPEVAGLGVVAVAAGALAVNGLGLWILRGGRKDSLNMRGVWLHVMTDALSSIGAIAAGLAIWGLDWRWADPLASLLIAALVLISAWQLVREAVDVLMEAAPKHLDVDEIRIQIEAMAGIDQVHDLHVWTIASNEVSLSSHVVARDGAEPAQLLRRVYAVLSEQFGIHHSTIQIESSGFAAAGSQTQAAACPGTCESGGISGS